MLYFYFSFTPFHSLVSSFGKLDHSTCFLSWKDNDTDSLITA